MSSKKSNSRRRLSFQSRTKLGMTLGKGANGNVVKTVADNCAFAKNGVQPGWIIVKVNRTVVDANTAFDTLKYAVKQGGEVKLEFRLPPSGDRKVMFDGRKKCGFTLEQKSNVVKSVVGRGVAAKAGVEKGWVVLSVDGTKVDKTNVVSMLKQLGKSKKKYLIIFGVPTK